MPECKLDFIRRMSNVKKAFIVFVVLLLFIIIVEQPGSDSSKMEKRERFVIPKIVMEEINEVEILRPGEEERVLLNNKEGKWRVTNGHSFFADTEKVDGLLKILHELKETEQVSDNPERSQVFGVDKETGNHMIIKNNKNKVIGDLYIGKRTGSGQYLRHADSKKVFKTTPNLYYLLSYDVTEWKDKTLLFTNESDIKRLALKNPEEEYIIQKDEETKLWRMSQPRDYFVDSLTMRTLFEQLKQVKADAFVPAEEGSQADFTDPDYKISVRNNDDSLDLVLFKRLEEEGGKIYAKNPDNDLIYSVSETLIDNIFGLEFGKKEERDFGSPM